LARVFQPAFDQIVALFENVLNWPEEKSAQADIKNDHVQNCDQGCGIREYSNHFLSFAQGTDDASDSPREAIKVRKNNIHLSDCQQWSCARPRRTEFERSETGIAKVLDETVAILRLAEYQ